MSASINPTLNPFFANATARFAVTVDFPTPPFPDAIAITFLTLGNTLLLLFSGFFGIGMILISSSTLVPRIRFRCNSQASIILFLLCIAGLLICKSKLILLSFDLMLDTKFNAMMSFFKSGSITKLKASLILSVLISI